MTEKNKNYVYGIRSIIEAIRSGKEIEKLLLSKQAGGDLFNDLFALAREHQIPTQFVPLEKLNRMTYKNHQGAIAYISEISFFKIEHIVPTLFEEGKTPLILILDSITDVRNFGAIVRTAECAGVHAIIIPEKGSAPVNSDAVKTSSGALHSVPVCRVKSLHQIISYLKNSGIHIVATTEKVNNKYYDSDFTLPTAIIMGSEDEGIQPNVLQLADEAVCIPLSGNIASLNVSVATGIILFEAVKHREKNGTTTPKKNRIK
jgi:23S rRNA (guanosine2251-2'-O)-methyltransferase